MNSNVQKLRRQGLRCRLNTGVSVTSVRDLSINNLDVRKVLSDRTFDQMKIDRVDTSRSCYVFSSGVEKVEHPRSGEPVPWFRWRVDSRDSSHVASSSIW